MRAYWTAARMRQAQTAATREETNWDRTPALAASATGNGKRVRWDNVGVRAIGVVYSVKPDGTPWGCSGTLVESANRSVIWTAGHCVHGGRGSGPFTHIMFVPDLHPTPGHQTASAPLGVWPATRAATTSSWAREGDAHHIRRDFGAVVVGRDPFGRTITDVVGGAHALSFRPRASRTVSIFGYPGSSHGALEVCLHRRASTTRPPNFGGLGPVGGSGPAPLESTCTLGAGMSGGPWLTAANHATGLGTIVSVTSAKFDRDPRPMFGPVQDQVARQLFKRMAHVPVKAAVTAAPQTT